MDTIALHLTSGVTTSQVIVAPHEAYTLPRACKSIRVVYGTAWVSFAGEAVILRVGEQMDLITTSDSAVISATRKTPVILEVAD